MTWHTCKLGDVVRFQRGHDLPEQHRKPGDVPVIGSAGQNGWHNEAIAKGPGVSIGRSGASIGKVTYTPVDYWPHNACLYVTDFLGNDPRFVYYFLKTKDFSSLNSGAAQPSLNRNFVHDVEVTIPGPNEQAAIAEVLSAYDALIENNRRRIALLEEAAQMLYCEWFVRFRFPGHEHINVIDGIPEGWSRRTLATLAQDVSYGFTASAAFEIDGPRFLRITDIVDGPIQWESVPRCTIPHSRLHGFLLAPDDIVVARTGATTGWARRAGRLPEPAVFASYLVRFRFGKNYLPELAATYMQSDSYKAFVRGNLGGAAQPNASAKVLGSAAVPVPPPSLQSLFAGSVRASYEQVDVLVEQNQKLVQARDLLLTRLMNGEIAV